MENRSIFFLFDILPQYASEYRSYSFLFKIRRRQEENMHLWDKNWHLLCTKIRIYLQSERK